MKPISEKSLIVKKQLLPHQDVFGSIDSGASLTKLLYKKSIGDDPDRVSLQMAFYRNCDFEKAIDWLVERTAEEGAQGQKLHLTGVGSDMHRDMIEEKLNLKIQFIDEYACQNTGCHFLAENYKDDEFCYEDEHLSVEEFGPLPDWLVALTRREAEAYGEVADKRLPAIFAFCGSAITINVLHKNKKMEVLGGTMFGGRTMMAMSKLIVGTDNYDELMELAGRGRRNNVDTEAGEMVARHSRCQFPGMPVDFPMFPLGKVTEMDACHFTREDLAAGVVGSVMTSLIPQLTAACKLTRVPKVYMGGHVFRSRVARQIFNRALFAIYAPFDTLSIRFISNGHTGCLGAFLLTASEVVNHLSNPKTE